MITVRYAPVPQFSRYQAGDDGNIRRHVAGDVWLAIKQHKNDYGYMVTSMQHDQRGEVQQFVHRVVLSAFVGPPDNPAIEACHNNGLRFDNRLINLRWDTHIGNESDKRRHGTSLIGERNHQVRLTTPDVVKIKKMIADGVPTIDIAHIYGVSRTAIYWIKVGRQWKHV